MSATTLTTKPAASETAVAASGSQLALGAGAARDAAPGGATVLAAVEAAARRVPPLWPLESFVAVNPFLGWTEQDFGEAARSVGDAWGARLTMPRAFYRAELQAGRIADRHLEASLAAARERDGGEGAASPDPTLDVAGLRAAASRPEPASTPLPTVSSVLAERTGEDWTRWITERVATWAGAYFDRGQASWPCPWSDRTPWRAWKAQAALDRSSEVMGITGFRETVASLPEDPDDALLAMLGELELDPETVQPYLERLLGTVMGWVAWVRYEVWETELRGGTDERLKEMVAIRLAFEVALLRAFEGDGLRDAWRGARALLRGGALRQEGSDIDLLLHEAYELAFQERLLDRFHARAEVAETGPGRGVHPSTADHRATVQGVFCIDVRSEIYRRALEATGPEIRTLGFAGFFGFPVEYVRLGDTEGRARCPVLLTPDAVIHETVGGDAGATEKATRLRRLREAASAAWLSFKLGAVSCFAFVGPVGLAYIRKLVTDGLGLTRPVPDPRTRGLGTREGQALTPDLEPGARAGRPSGMGLQERIDTAEGALRGMSLTRDFARLVVLAGHGSTVVNNPHATGLDCGACGGQSGEVNARVAARVFNDPAVRAGLAERGIEIPGDTVFVAARHDTTLDEVTLLDGDLIPDSHSSNVAELRERLADAGRAARAERAPSLNVRGDVDRAIRERSRDWSQVRPEWGLAGCAAFVAAPRARTRGLDLSGRVFLHDYGWRDDTDFGVLELIMTAPVVVASWISLQYYGSTVDNRVLGSGNKTLHNVVGALGVLEGNQGDLRLGLPLQSVYDGGRFVHEPLRLNVVIEAPREAMTEVIDANQGLRDLLDNRWLHLWSMDGEGRITHRYAGDLTWSEVRPSRARTALESAPAA